MKPMRRLNQSIKARLFWMGKNNLAKGERYKLKLATQELDAEIVSIEKIIDASTLEKVAKDVTTSLAMTCGSNSADSWRAGDG
jgi:bifunctional enzyme CysN/CysC/sulfate adenylyltransferase subunit 1